MKTRQIGIFEYIDPLPDKRQDLLPETLQLCTATSEALLLRLLLGQIYIRKGNDIVYKLRTNFLQLPKSTVEYFSYKSIIEIFRNSDYNLDLKKESAIFDNYFNLNRKNFIVHEKVLFEISSYLSHQPKSPITAFANLYRCLEYISYSFPMVYASKSKNYMGTFNDLKSLFKGEATGELKFFGKFLRVLFDDEELTLSYKFEMNLNITQNIDSLSKDCKTIYAGIPYEIENEILGIKFEDILNFFITTRNRYFHMLVGQGQTNFSSIDYDIGEFFSSINPYLLNWLSIIILKISNYGFYSSLPGF